MMKQSIAAWRSAIDDLLELAEGLSESEWSAPTALPLWTVRDVVAHVAHLEAVLAGLDSDPVRATEDFLGSRYTQAGVDARRHRTPEALIDEVRRAADRRSRAFEGELPDPATFPTITPGGVQWTWDTMLRNRVVDVWTHDQDIRAAIGRPGCDDTAGARITVLGLVMAMPYVLGRKVSPGPGSSARWTLTGPIETSVTCEVGADGRSRRAERDDVDVELAMSSPTFARLATGRTPPAQADVDIVGDEELGRLVLAQMNVLF